MNKDTLKEKFIESFRIHSTGVIVKNGMGTGSITNLDDIAGWWLNEIATLIEQERKEESSRIFNYILENVADEHGLLEINQLLEVCKGNEVECVDWSKEALSQNTTQEDVTNGK